MKNKYTYKIWDKETPVNGISADRLRQINPIPGDGEAYIIFNPKKQPIVFQWHNPLVEGIVPMTETEAIEFGAKAVEELNASLEE